MSSTTHKHMFRKLIQIGVFYAKMMDKIKHSTEIRRLAQLAWKTGAGDEAKAYQCFVTWCGKDKPCHARDLLRRWGPRESTKNKQGQGRPRKIPRVDAKKLAKVYKRGFTTCGQQRGFRSVSHAKIRSKKAFAGVLQRCHNPTDETVRNAIKDADPNIGMVQQCPKKELS
jgi:hypothetical protein